MSDVAPRIQICGRCHHAGHKAYACPSRPDGSSATVSLVPQNRRPLDTCWSCGEFHYSDECAIQAQRKATKQCIICGDERHWMKACSRYNEVVKNPKPCPNNSLWCPRYATEGHSTSRCATNGARYPFNTPLAHDSLRVNELDRKHLICLDFGAPGLVLCLWQTHAPSVPRKLVQGKVSTHQQLVCTHCYEPWRLDTDGKPILSALPTPFLVSLLLECPMCQTPYFNGRRQPSLTIVALLPF